MIVNDVDVSGWAIFVTGNIFSDDYHVERLDALGLLPDDETAWALAREAGVPVDENGRVPVEWMESRDNYVEKGYSQNFER